MSKIIKSLNNLKNKSQMERIKYAEGSIRVSPSLQNSIKSLFEREKYTNCEVKAKEFISSGGSYMGKLYEIEIEAETTEGKIKTDLFIKEIIELKLTLVSIKEIYLIENFAYMELSRIFCTLQDTANVPRKDRFKMAKAYDETNPDAIILENLRRKDFKTYERIEVLPFKFVELAIQELAKFHAMSFVIEKNTPDYFNNVIKQMKHPLKYVEEWNRLMRNVCEYLKQTYDLEMKKKIDNFLETFVEKMEEFNYDQKSFICGLTHGDYNMNNVLAREMDGEPEEVMIVDYQLVDYGCQIRDFLFFIFSSTDREFRKQHLNDLKQLYFETLSRFLNYFNIDVETVYPRREFENAYTKYLDYGLIKVLYGSSFLFAPKSGVDLHNISEIGFSPDKKVEMKIRELIEEFVEWGYL